MRGLRRWHPGCPLVLACVLLLARLAAADSGRQLRAQRIPLRQGAIEVQIRFDAGQEAWAAYQLRHAAAYLPAVEGFLGVAFHEAAPGFFNGPPPPALRIEGQHQVFLHGAWIGAYNNSAGLFPGDRAIFVEYRLTPLGRPSLVLHELGHFWLYDSAGVTQRTAGAASASWFNEGAVSHLPLALVEARLLRLTPAECAAIGQHWGVERVPYVRDVPIEEDLRPRGGTDLLLFYEKAFQVHALLRAWLGPAAYRRLLQRAARSPERLAQASGVLALLADASPLPWRQLLGGWVFRGPYGAATPLLFRGALVRSDGTLPLPGLAPLAPAAGAPRTAPAVLLP